MEGYMADEILWICVSSHPTDWNNEAGMVRGWANNDRTFVLGLMELNEEESVSLLWDQHVQFSTSAMENNLLKTLWDAKKSGLEMCI